MLFIFLNFESRFEKRVKGRILINRCPIAHPCGAQQSQQSHARSRISGPRRLVAYKLPALVLRLRTLSNIEVNLQTLQGHEDASYANRETLRVLWTARRRSYFSSFRGRISSLPTASPRGSPARLPPHLARVQHRLAHHHHSRRAAATNLPPPPTAIFSSPSLPSPSLSRRSISAASPSGE